jgi:FkbH-like protein
MLKTSNAREAALTRKEDLRLLLREKDGRFWEKLSQCTRKVQGFDDLLFLSTLRRKAEAAGPVPGRGSQAALRFAMVGGYSLYPLSDLLKHLLSVSGFEAELFLGQFDNYVAEMSDSDSGLCRFKPEVILVIPSERQCRYPGRMNDSREAQQAAAAAASAHILELCRRTNERTGAEILLCNFPLPASFDPGPGRARTLGSDWSFRKLVNLELGLSAPACVHICDLEFLAYRRGAVNCRDPRAWFESKQIGSGDFLADIAREVALLVESLRRAPKKVLALDLDNTLWGGVVGDDGLDGIEIGETSPRGEAFRAFQTYVKSLGERGVLLAVCSKNDIDKAKQPFEQHPEMVLRMVDIGTFKANWSPKSDNLREIAEELNLALDSIVFADDNPAEIEIVRQFAPQVTGVLLGPDPAEFVRLLDEARLFEPRSVTAEDLDRGSQYRQEAARRTLHASTTDMPSYLASLEMAGAFREFTAVDVPRIAQLINKSNQFNLTTRRRAEGEVAALAQDPCHECFSLRLRDRFGDYGLISVVIGRVDGAMLDIDTWLMSCRVLNREVEQEVLNEIVRLARLRSCEDIIGRYLPTPKNGMVRDLYPRMGFRPIHEAPDRCEYRLNATSYSPAVTAISIDRRTHEPS